MQYLMKGDDTANLAVLMNVDKLIRCKLFILPVFSKHVPEPAASLPPGNLLEMQVFRTHSKPTASEPLGVGPAAGF